MRPRIITTISLCVAAAVATLAAAENRAEACGCLSPPAVEEGDYAVNQQAEQIIFEVEDGYVTAHVSIRYAGAPESFAWIVPVPSVPELALSPAAAFALLDRDTAPQISVETRNLCPESKYFCRYQDMPICEHDDDDDPYGSQDAGAGGADGASDGNDPPVVVVDRQTIGSYETIIFSAGDTEAATEWLRGEGFIVNDTMAPYMQPYADAGMLFVAAKLVPGADVTEIQPLRMRFASPAAMIPLQLTAVAAEPHLTVTAYVYGDDYFRAAGLPLVNIDPDDLARDDDGRNNYPMLVSRAIDLAGGRGFVAEYVGAPVVPDFDQGTGCCSNEDFDSCGIEFDGICSCPGNPFDVDDCAEDEDLVAGVALLEELSQRHTRLTRLTTRLSPEEMDHDPSFEPMPAGATPIGRLRLAGRQDSLAGCEAQILEPTRYEAIADQATCATTYCGAGECTATAIGPGCDCDEGYVARRFTDLDGAPSVTCVPSVGTVDYEAGGLALPSACEGVSCAAGVCVDVGGFPTCACDPGNAAVLASSQLVAICRPITSRTGTPGAQDYTAPFEDIPVCAPPPPTCGQYGWLDEREVYREGVQCESSLVDPADLIEPDAPTCADLGLREPGAGCGCTTGNGAEGALGALLIAFAAALSWRRRRVRS